MRVRERERERETNTQTEGTSSLSVEVDDEFTLSNAPNQHSSLCFNPLTVDDVETSWRMTPSHG